MKVSIVVPVFNSSGFLHLLLEHIELVRKAQNWNLELILVDDGSQDNVYSLIESFAQQYPYIKGIKLSRNFGHQVAVRTGLSFVTQEYVAIIDDDMQDPPELLPGFFEYLKKGYEVVYGVRRKRKEGMVKVTLYNLFYKVLARISDTHIPLDSGDFCVMTKKVVDHMLLLNESKPFLRGIRAWVGFRQLGLEYERNERFQGKSGYTIKKLLQIAFDGIFAFSSFPIRVISFLGFAGLSIGLLYAIYILTLYFFYGISIQGFTSIVLLVIFFGSLNLISVGLAGEYIYRIFLETKKRPHAVIAATINV